MSEGYESSKNEEDLVSERDFLLGLQKHQGYQDLIAAMTEKVNQVTNEIMQPISNQEEVFQEQYKKGVIFGAILAASWVNRRIEEINEDLDFINRKRGTEDED